MSKLNEMIEQYNALVGTQNKLIKQSGKVFGNENVHLIPFTN